MSNDKLINNISELSQQLKAKKGFDISMLIGVDGFVDEIVHAVDQRISVSEFTRIKTLADFGNRIAKAAGLSTNIEMVTVQTKLGGNGPILSNALLEYGVSLTYIGSLGEPDIHPVFKPMALKGNVISVSNPGYTDAAEFEDGKLMLGKHQSLKDVTWEKIKEKVGGVEKLAEIINKCKLFGMENWTMMPFMSEVWEGLISEVFPLLNDREEKPLAFFDLADPEKRTREDILHALKLIDKFEDKFRVILGLNKKEVYEIADVLELYPDKDLQDITTLVYKALNIYCLVVHPTKEACCFCGDYFHTEGPYTDKPLLTTGAGDNFNAGFCLGQSLGLSPQLSLVLGVATSGYYVRNAKSPTYDNLIEFLDSWKETL